MYLGEVPKVQGIKWGKKKESQGYQFKNAGPHCKQEMHLSRGNLSDAYPRIHGSVDQNSHSRHCE